jgi:hypothetical protein
VKIKTGKKITQRRRVNRDSQRRGESQKKEFYAEGRRGTEGAEGAEKRGSKEECVNVRKWEQGDEETGEINQQRANYCAAGHPTETGGARGG